MYSTFDNVRKSLETAWKYKILWVFAVMIAFGASSTIGNSVSKDRGKDTQNTVREESTPDKLLEDLKNGTITLPATPTKDEIDSKPVLGTSSQRITVRDLIPHITILSFFFIAFIVISICLGLILKNWAFGSFIFGTLKATNNEIINLRELSNKGRATLGNLIKLELMSFLFSLCFITVLGVLFLCFFLPLAAAVKAILGIIFFVLFLLWIFLSIIYMYSYIFAVRLVVFDGSNAWTALKAGYVLFKNNLGNTVKLSLANCLVQMLLAIATTAVIAILAVMLFGGIGLVSFAPALLPLFIIVLITLGIPTLFAIVLALSSISGFMDTYNHVSWTNLYNFIKGRMQ